MRAIKSANTRPELIVRRLLHRMGYRYRLHSSRLPGRPDLGFASKKKVILVNGCFWHRHTCRQGASIPNTNTQIWERKFQNNIERDLKNQTLLEEMGWQALIVWECETKSGLRPALELQLRFFLDSGPSRLISDPILSSTECSYISALT